MESTIVVTLLNYGIAGVVIYMFYTLISNRLSILTDEIRMLREEIKLLRNVIISYNK